MKNIYQTIKHRKIIVVLSALIFTLIFCFLKAPVVLAWVPYDASQDTNKCASQIGAPTNLKAVVGMLPCDEKPIVSLDWSAPVDLNILNHIFMQNIAIGDASYSIEKVDQSGNKTIVMADDSTSDFALNQNVKANAGGVITDTNVEWGKSYRYNIYAYDKKCNSKSVAASITVVVKKAKDCLHGLELVAARSGTDGVKLNWKKYEDANDYLYKIYREKDNNEQLIKTVKKSEESQYMVSGKMQFTDSGLGSGDYHYFVEVWGMPDSTSQADQPVTSCATDFGSGQPAPTPSPRPTVDRSILSIISNTDVPQDHLAVAPMPQPTVVASATQGDTNILAYGGDMPNDVQMRVNIEGDDNANTVNTNIIAMNSDGSVSRTYTNNVTNGDNIKLPAPEGSESKIVVTFDNSSTSAVITGEEYNNLAQNNNDVSRVGTVNVRADGLTSPTYEQAIKQAEDQKTAGTEAAITAKEGEANTQIQNLSKQVSDLGSKINDPNTPVADVKPLIVQRIGVINQINIVEHNLGVQVQQIIDSSIDQQSLINPEMQASREEVQNLNNQSYQDQAQIQKQLDNININQAVDIAGLNKEFKVQEDTELRNAIINLTDPATIKEASPTLAQKLTDYNTAESQIFDKYVNERQALLDQSNKVIQQTQTQIDNSLGNPQSGFLEFIPKLPQQIINDIQPIFQEVKTFFINDLVNPVKNLFSRLPISKTFAQTSYQVSQDNATVKDTTSTISLFTLNENNTQQPLSNNTYPAIKADQDNIIIVEAKNFTNTKNYQLYLDNQFISEGKVLGDGFAVKLTLPRTTTKGTHTIKLLGDAKAEQAQATITINQNQITSQRYWTIGIAIGVIILLIILIIIRLRMSKKPVSNINQTEVL